jgi:hypothetical protein
LRQNIVKEGIPLHHLLTESFRYLNLILSELVRHTDLTGILSRVGVEFDGCGFEPHEQSY